MTDHPNICNNDALDNAAASQRRDAILGADAASSAEGPSTSAIDDSTPQSISSTPSVITPWPSEQLRLLLQQQMRQHVQMLTQSYVMCRTCVKPEEVVHVAEDAKMLINELLSIAAQSPKGDWRLALTLTHSNTHTHSLT